MDQIRSKVGFKLTILSKVTSYQVHKNDNDRDPVKNNAPVILKRIRYHEKFTHLENAIILRKMINVGSHWFPYIY